jgi:hypothetical protein
MLKKRTTEKAIIRNADRLVSAKENLDALSWSRVEEIADRLRGGSVGAAECADLARELIAIAQANKSALGKLGLAGADYAGFPSSASASDSPVDWEAGALAGAGADSAGSASVEVAGPMPSADVRTAELYSPVHPADSSNLPEWAVRNNEHDSVAAFFVVDGESSDNVRPVVIPRGQRYEASLHAGSDESVLCDGDVGFQCPDNDEPEQGGLSSAPGSGEPEQNESSSDSVCVSPGNPGEEPQSDELVPNAEGFDDMMGAKSESQIVASSEQSDEPQVPAGHSSHIENDGYIGEPPGHGAVPPASPQQVSEQVRHSEDKKSKTDKKGKSKKTKKGKKGKKAGKERDHSPQEALDEECPHSDRKGMEPQEGENMTEQEKPQFDASAEEDPCGCPPLYGSAVADDQKGGGMPAVPAEFARFRSIYSSRDGAFALFEDHEGHITAVDTSKLA